MKQQWRNKAKRWLTWISAGTIAVILALCGFWYWINIPPQIDIPNPVMPNPNGYDYFVRAAAAYVDDNVGVDELTDSHISKPGETKHYPLAAKEAWLQKNAKAFRLLREGLKYPALQPPIDSKIYSQFRDLARTLVVESHVRAEHGNWRGAADSVLDGIEFGYDIQRGGPLIAGLVGNAVLAISLRELDQISPNLDAETTKQVAKRMENLHTQRFPYFQTMQQEKWATQAKTADLMKNKFWRVKTVVELSYPARVIAMLQQLPISYSPPSRFDIAKEFLTYSRLFFISNRRLMANYTALMDAHISNGQVAYAKRKPVPFSGDPLTQIYASAYKDTRWNWARMETSSTLIMTTLALRAFKSENGHYPSSLKQLVPEYLSRIPIDPFVGNAPLHYQLQGKKYLLWSIGPDGVDNQGTPVVNRDKPENARYRLLEPDSKGDVVAGINVP